MRKNQLSQIITTTRRVVLDFLLFVRFAVKRYIDDGCADSSAALTYTSLFATVPLLTVSLGVITLVPMFEPWVVHVQAILFEHLVPATGEAVQGALQGFQEAAKNLTGLSLLLLVATVVMLLNTIESAFNKIWGVKSNRSIKARILLYWALITLGPMLLAAVAAITAYIETSETYQNISESGGGVFLVYLPMLLGWLLLTLLFVLVPNCHVRFKHAAVAGVLTLILLQAAEQVFALGLLGANYSNIYGAFAALPVFLIWLYLVWLIVLFGANLTRCLPDYYLRDRALHSRLVVALSVLSWLYARRDSGELLSETDWIKGKVKGLPTESHADWLKLRERLIDARLLVVTEQSQLAIGRDLTQYSKRKFLATIEPNFLMNRTVGLLGAKLPESFRESMSKVSDLASEELNRPLSEWLGNK